MQLLRLEIRNFRVIREACLEFPDALIGIIGPNGAGKSSIIEAISWALYGNQVARSGKDEIKASYAGPAVNTEVRLEFMLHGHRYLVVRRLAGRTERPEVELSCDGRPESVGSVETRGYVGQLLGLDWRGFLSSFLARQQELNALSDLAPAKRREHLVGMLGIGRLDRAIQRLKEENKSAEERTATLQRLLAGREQVAERVAALAEHITSLGAEQQRRRDEAQTADREWQELVAQGREHETKRQSCSQLRTLIAGVRQTREHLARQAENLKGQLATMEASRQEHERLAPERASLAEAIIRLEAVWARKAQAALKAELADQMTRLHKELAQIEGRLPELAAEWERLEKEDAGQPADLEARSVAARADLESARNEYGRLVGRAEALAGELKRARLQVAAVAEIGPEAVCDRCHRPYGDDLPTIKAHLEAELVQLTSREAELMKGLESLKQSGKVQKGAVEELESQIKRRDQRSAQLGGVRSEEDRLRNRRTELTGQMERVTEQLTGLGEVGFDPEQLREVERQVLHLEKVRQESDRLAGFLAHRPKVETDLTEVQGRLRDQEAELSQREAELAGIGFDEPAFVALVRKRDEAGERLERAKAAEVAISRDLALAQQEQKDRSEELARLAEGQKELEVSRDTLFYGVKLAGLLAEFRKDLIAQIRPRLAELAGELLGEMTDGRYQVVELDEEYNIRIFDNGQFFGIERFSGGEKDLANLCLRLAISLALAESAGLSRSFVILDEVFASQDDSRRELILGGLAGLKNRFPQILLITHIAEIKDRVEQVYDVRPTGLGWSEVRLNGGA